MSQNWQERGGVKSRDAVPYSLKISKAFHYTVLLYEYTGKLFGPIPKRLLHLPPPLTWRGGGGYYIAWGPLPPTVDRRAIVQGQPVKVRG